MTKSKFAHIHESLVTWPLSIAREAEKMQLLPVTQPPHVTTEEEDNRFGGYLVTSATDKFI